MIFKSTVSYAQGVGIRDNEVPQGCGADTASRCITHIRAFFLHPKYCVSHNKALFERYSFAAGGIRQQLKGGIFMQNFAIWFDGAMDITKGFIRSAIEPLGFFLNIFCIFVPARF